MARIKLGAMFSDLRGTLQNAVYSLAKGGVRYVKSVPTVVTNPNSSLQERIRRLLHEAVAAWSGLTASEKAEWEEVAQRCAGLAKEGGGGILNLVPPIGFDGSGINAYAAFRARALYSGVTLVNFDIAWKLGVATEAQPTSPAMLTLSCLAGTVTCTWTDPIVSDATAKVSFRMRSRDKLYHPQVVANVALAVQTLEATAASGAKGVSIDFADALGANMIGQLQTINPSGWASPGSNVKEVTLV